jgi:hypothetical protein
MRASSLSHPRVISLLNSYFVPVYVANADYRADGSAPADEKAEKLRIYREALKAKLSAGTVHAYVLSPDGHPIDSLHVARAAKVEETTAMLERAIERLQTSGGEPLVKPGTQSAAPPAAPGALVLHLTSRNVERRGDDLVPRRAKLGQNRSGSWGAYAAENWIVLGREESRKLLPPGKADVGTEWEPDPEVAARVLTHFYPSTENNDVRKNRIEEQQLRAKVVSVQGGVARARLDGSLKMQHSFYHKDDGKYVQATFTGYLDFDPAARTVRSLRLVTDRANYTKLEFGVAVRSVP